MKPYKERIPLIDAAIEATDGDIERIKDYRKTDTYVNYTVKLGYFSVDSQWAFHGETICTHDEYEQRARELGYKPKEQEMNNDWYEKGELPPVGSVVRHKESGKDVEVKCHLRTGQAIGERLCHPLIEIGFASDFEPLRTETDKLVEQMCDDAGRIEGAELNPFIVAAIERLAEQGYRKIKPMSDDEFMSKVRTMTKYEMYRAGCRFIEQVKV